MKMSLDKTWTESLRMWKWISKESERRIACNIYYLKEEWLENNGYDPEDIQGQCFFCNYNEEHREENDGCCIYCPVLLIDPNFDCESDDYSFYEHPTAFYEKLKMLYEKYKVQKKGKKTESKKITVKKVVKKKQNPNVIITASPLIIIKQTYNHHVVNERGLVIASFANDYDRNLFVHAAKEEFPDAIFTPVDGEKLNA